MTQPIVLESVAAQPAARRFLVLWQDRTTREYHAIGILGRDAQGFSFSYASPSAEGSLAHVLPGFPDPHEVYRSPALFPTFANRVMTPRRDSYGSYLRALGIPGPHADPFEVLARTWGERATDTLQLLPVPETDGAGHLSSRFLVHGGRHIDPDGTGLAGVQVGDRLILEAEPENVVDPRAVLVCRSPDGIRLGYVPRPFAPFVHRLWDTAAPLTLTAEHVNLPKDLTLSNQLRLLVRLDAHVSEDFDIDDALGF